MAGKITLDQIMEAIEADDYLGFCTACGAEQGGCEPDAQNYECESCGERKVFGAEQLLIMGVGHNGRSGRGPFAHRRKV